MKKIFFSVIMSALFLIGSLSMISMAPPPENTNCNEFCGEFGDFFGSKGKCMSTCNVCLNKAEGPTQTANCVCKIFAEEAAEGGLNHGQCIKLVKSFNGGGDE